MVTVRLRRIQNSAYRPAEALWWLAASAFVVALTPRSSRAVPHVPQHRERHLAVVARVLSAAKVHLSFVAFASEKHRVLVHGHCQCLRDRLPAVCHDRKVVSLSLPP